MFKSRYNVTFIMISRSSLAFNPHVRVNLLVTGNIYGPAMEVIGFC